MVKMSSMGIKKGLSVSLVGSGTNSSRAFTSSWIFPAYSASPSRALEGDAEYAGKIQELVKALDEFVPEPTRDTDKPFLMPIEDIFTIQGRGTVVTGRIERGEIKVNEEIEIVGIRETQKLYVQV